MDSPKDKNLNIVLDLDNTLIYSIPFHKFPKRSTSVMHSKRHKVMGDEYVIFERPGLQQFLKFLFDNFNVMIWSAASREYVEFIVEQILSVDENNRPCPERRFEYVLHSDNCEDCQAYYGDDQFKNLRYLWDIHDLPGYGPYNTLIVDDLGLVHKTQPNNCIRVMSFNTNRKNCWEDNELLGRVKPILENALKHFEEDIETDNDFMLIEE